MAAESKLKRTSVDVDPKLWIAFRTLAVNRGWTVKYALEIAIKVLLTTQQRSLKS